MAIPLTLFNLGLRLTVKRKLARLEDPETMRRMLERDARLLLLGPRAPHWLDERIPAPEAASLLVPGAPTEPEAAPDTETDTAPRPAGSACPEQAAPPRPWIPALWASAGRPDRRRVILYLHGGAYIAGSPATHRRLGAELSLHAGARTLLPDYRLAPEYPLPAAVEDALAAYRFLLGKGIAPGNIAVAGDSAGGGLTFLLAQRIEAEALPPPAALVAFSPWTDLAARGESIRTNARRDAMLPAERLDYVSRLVRGPLAATDPRVSPVEGRIAAPPPALIFASQDEILADDARAMAACWRDAGGSVRLELWPGTPHGWPIFLGWIAEARRAAEAAGAFIADAMDRAAPQGDVQGRTSCPSPRRRCARVHMDLRD